jgi:pimeloyl-ACP methyl ester carboxylesterase
MPYFHHDDLNFYFEEHGSGTPFLFSHGLAGDVEQAKELVGSVAGFRLLLYDNRGHGKTGQPGPVDRLNFSTMAGDAAALLNLLSIERAVVGGVSMGAGIALAFCLKYPHRARAAIFSRPAWLNHPAPPNLAIFPQIAAMIQEAGIEQARQLFEHSNIYAAWKEHYPLAASSVDGLFTGRSPDAIVATYQAIPRSTPYRTVDVLKRVDVPALVLANHNDPIHPFEYAEAWVNALPNAQLKELPSKTEGLAEHISTFRFYLRQFLRDVQELSLQSHVITFSARRLGFRADDGRFCGLL